MQHTASLRVLAGAALALAAQAAMAADGLRAPDAASVWPSFQARLSLTLSAASVSGPRTLRQAALLGDYYLSPPDVDPAARWRGGFRATSGLVLGSLGVPAWAGTPRVSLLPAPTEEAAGARSTAFVPYVGLGYTGLAPHGGWGFSADVGLALRQPGQSSDLGGALPGLRGWEGTLQRLNLMPMVQLGVRYSF